MTATDDHTRSPQPSLGVDHSGCALTHEDRRVFLLTDTLSRMPDQGWAESLRRRRRQGFNAVNVGILPVAHDRSTSSDDLAPFVLDAEGGWA